MTIIDSPEGVSQALLEALLRRVPDLPIRAAGRSPAPGWLLLVRDGNGEKVLLGARSRPRVFKSLDAVDRCLRGIGRTTFEVDSANHQEGLVRRERPDRRAVMKVANRQSRSAKKKKTSR